MNRKSVLAFNYGWGTFVLIFSFFTFCIYYNDGDWNYGLTLEEYLVKGGNTFDYYAGYLFFTSIDVTPDDIPVLLLRCLHIGLLTSIWYVGIYEPSNFFTTPIEKTKEEMEILSRDAAIKYRRLNNISLGVTTLMSLYGIYYFFVYIFNFWHQ